LISENQTMNLMLYSFTNY